MYSYLNMSDILSLDTFNYSFPVIKGIQSGREYFVAMVPLRLISSLFLFNDSRLPPEMRAQRLLNKSRVPSITRYLVENPENYTFSSLTASIDRIVEFSLFLQRKRTVGSVTSTSPLIQESLSMMANTEEQPSLRL